MTVEHCHLEHCHLEHWHLGPPVRGEKGARPLTLKAKPWQGKWSYLILKTRVQSNNITLTVKLHFLHFLLLFYPLGGKNL